MKIFLIKIIVWLFNTNQNRVGYVLKAASLSLVSVMLIGIIIFPIFPDLESPEFDGGLSGFFSVVIISPVVETLILWLFIYISGIFMKGTWKISAVSALLFALVHSLMDPVWGLTIFLSFVVFSIAFIEWRKVSKMNAYLICCSIHMVHNLTSFVIYQIFS